MPYAGDGHRSRFLQRTTGGSVRAVRSGAKAVAAMGRERQLQPARTVATTPNFRPRDRLIEFHYRPSWRCIPPGRMLKLLFRAPLIGPGRQTTIQSWEEFMW